MDSKFSKIEDSKSFVKDENSRAVINNDNDAYLSYLSRKKKNKKMSRMAEDINDLKRRVISLENLINNSNK